MSNFLNTLQELKRISKNLRVQGVTVEQLDKAIRELSEHYENALEIEKSIEAIKAEVISPVKRELEFNKASGKFSVFGFWVGAIGLLVSIITLLIPYFFDLSSNSTEEKLSENIQELQKVFQRDRNKEFGKRNSIDFNGDWRGYIVTNTKNGEKGELAIRIVIKNDSHTLYYWDKETKKWNLYLSDVPYHVTLKDMYAVGWLNQGGVWTEHHVYSLSHISHNRLKVIWSRHVTNRESEKFGRPFNKYGDGELNKFQRLWRRDGD